MASINRDEISRLELLQAAHPDGLVFPHLADAYRRAGRYTQAETVLNAGLRHHSDYSSAHVVLGRLRLDQGKHEEAEQAFRRVLELDPQNQVAMESLGQVSLEQGRIEEALTQFRRLARLKPSEDIRDRVRELEQRVQELREDGRASSAAVAGQTTPAPSAKPGNGASAAADPPLEEEPAPAPTHSEPGDVVTETMAELYARQGLHQRAAAVYRQLLQRAPQNSRLLAKLHAAETAAAPAVREPGTAAPDHAEERNDHATLAEPFASPPSPPVTVRDHLLDLLSWGGGPGTEALMPDVGSDSEPDPPRTEAETAPAPMDTPTVGSAAEPAGEAAGEAGARSAYEAAVETGIGSGPRPPADPVSDLLSRKAGGGAAGDEAPLWSRFEREAMGETLGANGEAGAMARSLIAITDMLVGLLEYRDPFFRGSSSLTRLVAENVAVEMGLTDAERVDLALAAVLRDLGRLAMGGRLVPQSGQQTPEGRRKIERHVDLALHLLEGIELPRAVRLAVRHHHERWDGAGYPDGLSGEAIPRLARVLAVVDSFTAMVSPRTYRLPRKVPDAAREIRNASGTQYDPAVVDALMRVLERRDQPHLGFVQRPHILLVNPDQPGAVVTAAKLCSAGYLAEVSADAGAARERLRRVPVAALVVSAEAGEGAAAAFVRDLRVDPLFSALPVVVVDAETVALRVRLLESGADVCFPPGTTYAELQGTLGALVRRTVRTGRDRESDGQESAATQEAPWLALQGDVKDFPLTWLLQVMKYDSRTAAIGIRTGSADGAIYLQKGDAVHAQIRGGPKGEPALRRMLSWEKGRFTVQPDARPRERTIESSIMHLLLTQAVAEDHAAAGIFGAVSDES